MTDVGSLEEEAARLAEALRGWAGHRGPAGGTGAGAGSEEAAGDARGTSGRAAALGALADLLGGGEQCRLCPVCQLLERLRSARPEAYEQVAIAAVSLATALRDLVAAGADPGSRRPVRVDRIDIDSDADIDNVSDADADSNAGFYGGAALADEPPRRGASR